MSKGKYSPSLTRDDVNRPYSDYIYNADKQIPPNWTLEMKEDGEEYDCRLYYGGYDENGYDSYGYSAFDVNGNYIGIGEGIDRWGYTEWDYLEMSDDEFNSVCLYGGW